MADKYFEEIAERIESGEYFEDAKNWYCHKYIGPIYDRAYFTIYSTIILMLFFYAISVYVSVLPLKMSRPLPVSIYDQTQAYARIINIAPGATDNPQLGIQRYLVGRFVEHYEAFDYSNDFAKHQRDGKFYNFIKRFSSERVLNYYNTYAYNVDNDISRLHPSSRLFRYQDKTKRIIVVDNNSIRLVQKNPDQQKTNTSFHIATVDFFAYESNISGIVASKWRAELHYQFDMITYDKATKEFSPLNLVVTRYETKKLQ